MSLAAFIMPQAPGVQTKTTQIAQVTTPKSAGTSRFPLLMGRGIPVQKVSQPFLFCFQLNVVSELLFEGLCLILRENLKQGNKTTLSKSGLNKVEKLTLWCSGSTA